MDVELQILKHLKRYAQPIVASRDRYCEAYNDLFPEVRSYECSVEPELIDFGFNIELVLADSLCGEAYQKFQ